MSHSNRIHFHLFLVLVEVVLFMAAVVFLAYLAEEKNWDLFIGVSIFATILFTIVKIFEANPALKELLARDNMASKMALSAEKYGVCEFFNMQSAKDQSHRNDVTQQKIMSARNLYLCANSGASFLDQAIYRHWELVKKKLDEGIEFRVVLLDPYSKEKGFRNQLNVGNEQLDSKINLANLINLQNKYSSLEIRFVKYGMHETVFATESCLFFDPYHVALVADRIENRSFCLLIEPTSPSEGIGFYQLFKAHFDTLWRASTSFEDWINDPEVTNKLPTNLPNLKPR